MPMSSDSLKLFCTCVPHWSCPSVMDVCSSMYMYMLRLFVHRVTKPVCLFPVFSAVSNGKIMGMFMHMQEKRLNSLLFRWHFVPVDST